MSMITKFRNRVEKRIAYLIFRLFYRQNTKLVFFEAYNGEENGYSCNPKAIYEKMLQEEKYRDFHFVWSFWEPEKFHFLTQNPRTTLVKKGSYEYLKICAKSAYLFTNTSLPSYIVPNRHQKLIYLWHGKPLKCIGCGIQGEGDGKRSKAKINLDYKSSGRRLSILLSPAPIFTDIMCDAYALTPQKRKQALLEMGYPRNDFLFYYTADDVKRVKEKLKIPSEKKVILYAPTWRPYNWLGGNHFQHKEVLDYTKLYQELGKECVILCRLHHLEKGSVHYKEFEGFLYDVTDYPEVNELYIISDLMISDYSGTIFDYANLKRPIVLYMYDKEQYIHDANGLNFPLEVLPGKIVETQEELTKAVEIELEQFVYNKQYKTFNKTFNCLEGENSAGKILEAVIEENI
ncbi:MAG: CDP-glycerol glycerophosphotransferase family protein [Lachnospiraceae bacterium]